MLSTSFVAGVDSTVIALWLGHESVTTQIYVHADLTLKDVDAPRGTLAGG